MNQRAFSLIEVVIAIGIIGVIGVISSTILSRTYRSGIQSRSISDLKQNEDVAMSAMVETIRSSEAVVCYGTTTTNTNVVNCTGAPATKVDQIVVRSSAGQYTKFYFVDPVISASPACQVSSNGYIAKRENLNPSDYNNFCTNTLTSPAEVAITNKNSTTGVSIYSGQFIKLTSNNAGKDAVTIQFGVSPTLSIKDDSEANDVWLQTAIQVR